MKNLIDTIFNPILDFIDNISSSLSELSIPLSRPIPIENYLAVFNYLGPYWTAFLISIITMAFIYLVIYIIISQKDLLIDFKNLLKWW